MATQNLAIMFTDIKGFTERTSGASRAGMKSLLAEHDRLLVPVFQYFDGRIVKTIGDAFLVSFASPTDAVLCGVTIQEVLRQYNLATDEERRLDVRVAINVGEVELKDNDVLGEPVNIAARLEGVTEAGEVYFTDAVYQTMNRTEAPSADIGEKVFKGIPHPVRVYRVVQEPGSELATRLANGVRLSDRGPVLAGIRETIRQRRTRRLVLYGAAAMALVALVVVALLGRPGAMERAQTLATEQLAAGDSALALQTVQAAMSGGEVSAELSALGLQAAGARLDELEERGEYAAARAWLGPQLDAQPWLEPLRARLVGLEAREAVDVARTDSKYRGQYYPQPIKEFLARHASDPQAPVAVERALGEQAEPMSRVWLQRQALERGLAPDAAILAFNLGVQENGPLDWQLLDDSRALLRQYYPEEALAWAGDAIAGPKVLAFQNAWTLLDDAADPRLADPLLQGLHSLLRASDPAVLEAARPGLAAAEDPQRRAQVLGFTAELVDTFPRHLNSRTVRDALAQMRSELAAAWGEE